MDFVGGEVSPFGKNSKNLERPSPPPGLQGFPWGSEKSSVSSQNGVQAIDMGKRSFGRPGRLRFLTSASELGQCPQDGIPELALAGRSNGGKSSFINGLHGGNLAKVSSRPGKTRLLNYFDVEGKYRIVDMPGYGWASVSGREIRQWQEMVESYLSHRENLKGLVVIMDVRRNWSGDEQLLVDFLSNRQPSLVVLTKSDKLKRGPALERKKRVEQDSGLPCFLCSYPKAWGFYQVEDYIYKNWIRRNQRAWGDRREEGQ